jgi:hypothetical protein
LAVEENIFSQTLNQGFARADQIREVPSPGGTVSRSSVSNRVLSFAERYPRLATRNGVCKLRIWISSTDVVGTLAQSALVAREFIRTIRFCTAAK